MTRQKKIRYWRPALQDIIYSLMCVARAVLRRQRDHPGAPGAGVRRRSPSLTCR